MAIFRYQATHNPVYQKYLKLLNVEPSQVLQLRDIPFLPISLFKTHAVRTGKLPVETTFTSSGTTGSLTSRHPVADLKLYEEIATQIFTDFYHPPSEMVILALLPAYLERQGSSLVYMANHFIQQSEYPQSGFFLNDLKKLSEVLLDCQRQQLPTLLIGVSFALLDLAETFSMDLSDIIIMETGGMKGRRKEMTRRELHAVLKPAFNVTNIHSEYGMTELLSQGYSTGQERFRAGRSMKILLREMTDPFAYVPTGRTGVLNVIDLANLDSCSFIATDDLGRQYEDGSFEVLGRMDNSDLRGCNLLVS